MDINGKNALEEVATNMKKGSGEVDSEKTCILKRKNSLISDVIVIDDDDDKTKEVTKMHFGKKEVKAHRGKDGRNEKTSLEKYKKMRGIGNDKTVVKNDAKEKLSFQGAVQNKRNTGLSTTTEFEDYLDLVRRKNNIQHKKAGTGVVKKANNSQSVNHSLKRKHQLSADSTASGDSKTSSVPSLDSTQSPGKHSIHQFFCLAKNQPFSK